MNLACEIRIRIYEYSFEWPDMKPHMESIQRERMDAKSHKAKDPIWSEERFKFVAPNILLLNRQITAEAREVILKKTLFLDLTGEYGTSWQPIFDEELMLEIIPESIVLALSRVCFTVEHRGWMVNMCQSVCQDIFEELVQIWDTEQNLESIVVEGESTSEITGRVAKSTTRFNRVS